MVPGSYDLSRLTTKRTKWHVRPVWSESSLSAWRKRGPLATHWAHSEDTAYIIDRFLIIWTPFWFISVFELTAYLNSQNCSMFLLAFVAGSLQGHWWGFISRNYVVWQISFLMNVSLHLKELSFDFYLHSLQLVLCSVAAVKRLPVHQP